MRTILFILIDKVQFIALCMLLFMVLAPADIAAQIYWTDNGNDKISSSDGVTATDLLTSNRDIVGIDIDETNNKMYYTTASSASIRRANLDGSNDEEVLASGGFYIALDVAGGKMYWTIFGTGTVKRANLDGSNAETLASGLSGPAGIELDLTNNKVYWTEFNGDKISRSDLDGSNVEDISPSGLNEPLGITLDVASGKMYWVAFNDNAIKRANLDGSNVETLVSSLNGPNDIGLDLAEGEIYWIELMGARIGRANLDGSNLEPSFITGLAGSGHGDVGIAVVSFGILPVELVHFEGKLTSKGVSLSWATATEENNKGFEVQRSTDGKNWTTLDFVTGAGTTLETQNYDYTDINPLQGINYYRLKQLDLGGRFEYSDAVGITLNQSGSKVLDIFPNPVNDKLNIVGIKGQAIIYNVMGQVVRQFQITNDTHQVSTTELADGQYILQVQQENDIVLTERFMK